MNQDAHAPDSLHKLARDFKPEFIPWFEGAFQADRIVRRMTAHQRALYRNLLLDCYFGEYRPYLTAVDKELWIIADADSLKDWLTNKSAVLSKFHEVSDEHGEVLLVNNRVLEEWNILIARLEQKKNAGRASAAKRLARVPGAQNKTGHENTGHDSTEQHMTLHDIRAFNERSTTVEQPLGAQEKAAEGKPPKPSLSFSSHDMTTPETVGSRFEGLFAEDVIHAVSDGEFNLAALKSYDCTSELADACRETVQQMQNQPFVGRATCAEVMSKAMNLLRLRSVDAPRGWLLVLKRLREGGPATVEAPGPFKPHIRPSVQPERVLMDVSSALHCYEEQLKPYTNVLMETARYKGVPQSFSEAVPFLDCAIDGDIPHDELGAMIAVRNEIQSRIPTRAAH